MELYLLPLFILSPLIIFDFAIFLFKGKSFFSYGKGKVVEIYMLVVVPIGFLCVFDYNQKNDCCSESAFFSPHHRLSIYVLIGVCIVAYFYSRFRIKILPPLLELILNSFLVIGIALNIIMAFHAPDAVYSILGNIPIIIFFIYCLMANHRFLIEHLFEKIGEGVLGESRIYGLLQLPLFKRFPILLVIAVPLLILFACALLIFGQQPDALIQAFTDTYKHGLSELDCTNVTCPDGHFLCTIAANGHKGFVKPIRVGVRQNLKIKVNRQLLIANAFEDLLVDRVPVFHKHVRRLYNFIGGNCKRLYDVLGNKWIADVVYLLMKPLEWLFLISLYVVETNPESRIAKQYLYAKHRNEIERSSI